MLNKNEYGQVVKTSVVEEVVDRDSIVTRLEASKAHLEVLRGQITALELEVTNIEEELCEHDVLEPPKESTSADEVAEPE